MHYDDDDNDSMKLVFAHS